MNNANHATQLGNHIAMLMWASLPVQKREKLAEAIKKRNAQNTVIKGAAA